MATPIAVLQFLNEAVLHGRRSALVVLTGIDGGAARGIGTLMAVTEDGAWIGSFSGGCVEAALVGEAQRVIAAGKAELLRIGAGSHLIDIRLPCGSGIDLLIVPEPLPHVLSAAIAAIDARQAFAVALTHDGKCNLLAWTKHLSAGWHDHVFIIPIRPVLRLIIAGHGDEVPVLERLARAWGAQTLVLTPDERTAALVDGEVVTLLTPSANSALTLDQWSAFILLFHDHDWETHLLVQALGQHNLLVGAMGSRTTHARRIALLAEAGVPSQQTDRIRGPIGLIPAARDPETLALSILAEVVTAYNQL